MEGFGAWRRERARRHREEAEERMHRRGRSLVARRSPEGHFFVAGESPTADAWTPTGWDLRLGLLAGQAGRRCALVVWKAAPLTSSSADRLNTLMVSQPRR